MSKKKKTIQTKKWKRKNKNKKENLEDQAKEINENEKSQDSI
jgi:hypothetical protein